MRFTIGKKVAIVPVVASAGLLLATVGGTVSSATASAKRTVAAKAVAPKVVAHASQSKGTICVNVKPQTIGIVDLLASSPIDLKTDQMVELAATDLGWKYHFVDSNYNATTALQAINTFVNEHVNLIVDTSWDAGPIRAGLLAAKKAHIPVVELAAGNAPSPLFSATYAENETEMGRIVAQYIVNHVPNAKIADLATNANLAGTLRENALQSVVKSSGGKAQIVYDVQANLTAPGPNVQAALAAHPDINAFYLVFDDMDVAAAAELRTLGSKVKIYGYFTEPTNLALIKSGQIAAVADANLPFGGVIAIDQFLNHIKTGAAFDPKALAKAGGLKYTMVSTPTSPYVNTKTIAPYLTKWAKEYSCK